MKKLFQFLRDDDGAAAVETVVVSAGAVGLAVIVAGLLDFEAVSTSLGSSLGDGSGGSGVVGDALNGNF